MEMYNGKCTMENVQWKMYNGKCTMENVQCKINQTTYSMDGVERNRCPPKSCGYLNMRKK